MLIKLWVAAFLVVALWGIANPRAPEYENAVLMEIDAGDSKRFTDVKRYQNRAACGQIGAHRFAYASGKTLIDFGTDRSSKLYAEFALVHCKGPLAED